MPRWPVALRLLIAAVVFGATAWAFAAGQMLVAVVGIIICAVTFHRLFLTG